MVLHYYGLSQRKHCAVSQWYSTYLHDKTSKINADPGPVYVLIIVCVNIVNIPCMEREDAGSFELLKTVNDYL